MADCDLCGVSLPTLVPVRVFVPRFEHSYPEGIWKGLCESCLHISIQRAEKLKVENKWDVNGKCDLCSTKTQLYEITVPTPSFSNREIFETMVLCKRCLTVAEESNIRL